MSGASQHRGLFIQPCAHISADDGSGFYPAPSWRACCHMPNERGHGPHVIHACHPCMSSMHCNFKDCTAKHGCDVGLHGVPRAVNSAPEARACMHACVAWRGDPGSSKRWPPVAGPPLDSTWTRPKRVHSWQVQAACAHACMRSHSQWKDLAACAPPTRAAGGGTAAHVLQQLWRQAPRRTERQLHECLASGC